MGAQDLCIGTISRRITGSTARHIKINGGRAQLSPRSFFTAAIPAPRSLLQNADTAHPTCGLADSLLFLNVGATSLATFCAHRFFLRSKRTLFIIAVDVNALSTSESFELPIPIAAYFARSAAGMPFSSK